MDRDEGRHRDVAVAELLEHDRGVETAQRRAADVLLDVEAREAQSGGVKCVVWAEAYGRLTSILADDALLIVDTHVDVPYRLLEEMEDISQATENGDFDYPRARAGGLDAPFMSIYIPARFQNGGAKEHAEKLIDMVEGFERDHPDQFAVATSPAEGAPCPNSASPARS